MPTDRPIRPIVIAHRGASGHLPEHTFAAKTLAYAMGADYLEQDVVATLDDELVVLHDIHIDRVSNAASKFPERKRADGRYYVRDFSLQELRQLRLHERTNADGSRVYEKRFHSQGEHYRINTLAEEYAFIQRLQSSVGRPVGVYTEIKRPEWHRNEGVDITRLCLDVMREFDYSRRDDPAYLQCFDAAELRRARLDLQCDLKLIQLIGENTWGESSTDYNRLRSKRGLQHLARIVDGIGPWLNRLYRYVRTTQTITDSGLTGRAHEVGLAVHPYTVRKDDLPPGFSDIRQLLSFLIDEIAVDGFFSDFPEVINYLRKTT